MTQDEQLETLAGEYALGLLDDEARNAFEARLKREPEVARAVAFWHARLAPLDSPAEVIEPSAGLWSLVRARLRSEEAEATRSPITVRAHEGEWVNRAPGVDIKLLNIDPATKARSYLLRFAPGAELRAHDHLMDEECFMISGEATVGELHLKAGDYHLIPKHMAHGITYSTTGALVFVRGRVA
jgi:quercetin dioxygenase-like cupin family protein